MGYESECLRVSVGESLLKLAFGLDTSIFHILKVLRHVLHLVFQIRQISILTGCPFDHFYFFLICNLYINNLGN